MKTMKRRGHQPGGWMLIETLAGMAFLAVAAAMAVNMHHARRDYDRISTDRLRQRLRLENVALPFGFMPYHQLAENATTIDQQSGIRIEVIPFESDGTNGIQLSFKVTAMGGPLVHHLWRLEPSS